MKKVIFLFVLFVTLHGFAKGNHGGKNGGGKSGNHRGKNKRAQQAAAENGDQDDGPSDYHPTVHIHGAGKINISFENNLGSLEISVPSESVYGFEHLSTTEEEKKNLKDGLEKLEKNIPSMVTLDPNLKCVFERQVLDVMPGVNVKKGLRIEEHRETVGSFNIDCEKSPLGTSISLNVQKYFPRMKEITVSFSANGLQKSVKATKNGTVLELK